VLFPFLPPFPMQTAHYLNPLGMGRSCRMGLLPWGWGWDDFSSTGAMRNPGSPSSLKATWLPWPCLNFAASPSLAPRHGQCRALSSPQPAPRSWVPLPERSEGPVGCWHPGGRQDFSVPQCPFSKTGLSADRWQKCIRAAEAVVI